MQNQFELTDDQVVIQDMARNSRFSAMAKRLSTNNGCEFVNQSLQLFGDYGYVRDYPIERFWRDLRVHSILEGTNQVMRMIIGRDLLRQLTMDVEQIL
jgi:alkylation response protein AidB-like acyl-CoA dehydrogenase